MFSSQLQEASLHSLVEGKARVLWLRERRLADPKVRSTIKTTTTKAITAIVTIIIVITTTISAVRSQTIIIREVARSINHSLTGGNLTKCLCLEAAHQETTPILKAILRSWTPRNSLPSVSSPRNLAGLQARKWSIRPKRPIQGVQTYLLVTLKWLLTEKNRCKCSHFSQTQFR